MLNSNALSPVAVGSKERDITVSEMTPGPLVGCRRTLVSKPKGRAE